MDNSQDLGRYIKSMRRLKAVLQEGELFGVFSQRARNVNPRFWGEFWRFACEGVRISLDQSVRHLNSLFPTPRKNELITHCIQKKLLRAKLQTFEAFTRLSRDIPELFIPIPKIETGGCARSDSLVRSLIF